MSDTSHRTVSLLRWTHGLVNRGVMWLDFVTCLAVTVLARIPTTGIPPAGPHAIPGINLPQALFMGVFLGTLFVALMRWTNAYRMERYMRNGAIGRDLAPSFTLAALTGLLPLWAFVPDLVQRPGALLRWAGIVLVALFVERQIVRIFVRMVDDKALLRQRVAVIGATPHSQALLHHLMDPANAHHYEIIGVFDAQATNHTTIASTRAKMVAGVPVAGAVDDLIMYARHHPVDIVVVALPWEQSQAIFQMIEQVQWISADVIVPFDQDSFFPHFARCVSMANTPALQVMMRPFKGSQGVMKIAEDYIVASLALLILGPLMLAAALAIRLSSPGPVFFRQARLGFNGRPFMIYKFRTMTVDPADDGSVGTRRDDPRITRVGAFLRRTSIDEIPQLINVLRGEMSVVGPRPHVPNMLVGTEVYTQAVHRYAARHRIKPGITGWAQINGMRGGIHSMAKARRGVDLDLYYISNWSLRLDIKIMLRTLTIGMAGRNVF